MAQTSKNLNTIYISERMQERLRLISQSKLTSVVAPMGYGKTTAVDWYMKQRSEVEDNVIVRINIYSDNTELFWRSLKNALSGVGAGDILEFEYPQDDVSRGMAAVYLNIKAYVEHGRFLNESADIYEMLKQALLTGLSDDDRRFLQVMSLADEFTAEMAEFVTGNKNARKLLRKMTKENAFIGISADGKTYRFHYMLRHCARLQFKELLLQAIEEHNEWSLETRGNLLGECDLIMSFLGYNDIEKMSALHQSACRQMNRSAISIKKYGSWTFGSPSVLMMFHRTVGKMREEVEIMEKAMPYYYQVTNRHGAGAELLMAAEAAFMRGDNAAAEISLEKARQRAGEKSQRYMLNAETATTLCF